MSLLAPRTSLHAYRKFAVALALLALVCGRIDAGEVHPALREAVGSAARDGDAVVWVLFENRGFSGEEETRAALRRAQERIPEAALARRAKVGAARAGPFDLPVATAYRDAVARYGTIRTVSRWLNGVSARIAVSTISEIAALPFVREVRPVARGTASGIGPRFGPEGRLLERPDPSSARIIPRGVETRDDLYGPSFGQLDMIGVVAAHEAGYTGARVRLMMLDTGFRTDHNAFATADLLAQRDYVFGDDVVDNEGLDHPNAHWHGTATWGACGGFAPGALVGPAYGATFALAKTEDIRSETRIEEDHYVAALEWADSLGVDVTSASLSYRAFDDGFEWSYEELDGDTAPITRAIDRAAALGILCCNSAGNHGPQPGTFGEPADADSILSVGAVDDEERIAGFSSRGPRVDGMIKPEVVAQGVQTWCADADDPDSYLGVSGTSLSCPLVGGAVAVLLEAHPEWSAEEARQALLNTADRADAPDNAYGYGLIDLWAAMHAEPIIVPVPFPLLDPAEGGVADSPYPTLSWGRSADPQGGTIEYEVWVDEDPEFGSPYLYGGIVDTFLMVPDFLLPETEHAWRVIAEEPDGYRRLCRSDRTFVTPPASGVDALPPEREGFVLEARENPIRGEPVLRWFAPPGTLHESVRLTVFDATGRRIARETAQVERTGWNRWKFDPGSGEGSVLRSGVYFAMLEAAGAPAARTKIVLTR
ncbi:MAG: S8 family serine peptidase [Candidatus Eisenbacteria bacterium]|nr:S8 family serine peptidase [Candidatus Latescibacterota bacterium]MBD3302074.1 S8 family serine peptidase [Candidatus Eisenbacteria bacterium]